MIRFCWNENTKKSYSLSIFQFSVYSDGIFQHPLEWCLKNISSSHWLAIYLKQYSLNGMPMHTGDCDNVTDIPQKLNLSKEQIIIID